MEVSMKKVLILCGLIFVTTSGAMSQFYFGVKPGLTFNGASFGLKLGGIVLFGGLDYLHLSSNVEEQGSDVYWTSDYQYIDGIGDVYNYGYRLNYHSDNSDASLNIYLPTVGIKVLLGGAEKLDAYLTASFSKPILRGKASSNGRDNELQEFLDRINIVNIRTGFGTEYFFSDNFSIGGEFGINIFSGNYEEVKKDYESGPVGSSITGMRQETVETSHTFNLNLGIGLTYSLLCLNYYF